jgi:hypothetical protein
MILCQLNLDAFTLRTAVLSGLSLLYCFLVCRVHGGKTPQ